MLYPGWLSGAHQAALLFPLLNRTEREKMTRTHGSRTSVTVTDKTNLTWGKLLSVDESKTIRNLSLLCLQTHSLRQLALLIQLNTSFPRRMA